jgi:ribose 1,5-bisphosphokinase PhnN
MNAARGNYDSIISLGSNCAPAKAIRDYFSIGEAYPFDWWISSLSQLTSAVRGRFEKMFEPEEVVPIKVVDWSVHSTRYGIAYHHDFKRVEEGYVMTAIREELPTVEDKYKRRFSRLKISVSSGRTLFVRYGIQDHDRSVDEAIEDVLNLDAALRAIWPTADFDLLALPGEGSIEVGRDRHLSHVAFDYLGSETGEMWRTQQFYDLFGRRELGWTKRTFYDAAEV